LTKTYIRLVNLNLLDNCRDRSSTPGMKTKTIIFVTHYNPDLDACMTIWLLKRFRYPEATHVVEFVSMGNRLPSNQLSRADDIVYVDTSGGKYDHHNKHEHACSAVKVMEEMDLKDDLAIKRMVDYALSVDSGEVISGEVTSFDLLNIIEGLNVIYHSNPAAVVEVATSCLEGIYISLKQSIESERELKEAKIFRTRWGKGAGVVTSNRKTRYLAHRRGFKVFVYVDSLTGYRGFTAPGNSEVDFSSIFRKVKKLEPRVDWYLHTSRQLLLCGSGKAPNKKLSSLSLEQLINLIRT
jgi:hypothetical protein